MWKRREDENPSTTGSAAGTSDLSAQRRAGAPALASNAQELDEGLAYLGKSLVIKGELTGSEDVLIDGELDGNVELRGHQLTIGPNARVRASIHASIVVVQGKLDGKVNASERVELRKTAVLVGDIFTQRIAIEDGAYFKGGVDITKEPAAVHAGAAAELQRGAAAVTSASTTSSPVAGGKQPGSPPAAASFVVNQKK